jgi:hypothetical protein
MLSLYKKYQKYLPALFFVAGFVFDMLTAKRIDQLFSLIQQATYLFLIMILFYWEVCPPARFTDPESRWSQFWRFHVEIMHFLFGSLLSLYTIFYFKSASLMTSFYFMGVLAGLLILNEWTFFKKSGLKVRSALLALCLSSYFIYLVPVVTGAIGWGAFTLAMVLSISLFLLVTTYIQKQKQDESWIQRHILIPGLLVQTIFVALYIFKLLPPVPVSLKYIGIYHQVERSGDSFVLSYERDWWRLWQSGAQTFLRREGDQVHCFVSVFSPTKFQDQAQVRWLLRTSQGWQIQDTIPLKIRGGRAQGFRGYAYKSNFQEGDWQVRVLTSDEREVGRIYFKVVAADENQPRIWRHDTY